MTYPGLRLRLYRFNRPATHPVPQVHTDVHLRATRRRVRGAPV